MVKLKDSYISYSLPLSSMVLIPVLLCLLSVCEPVNTTCPEGTRPYETPQHSYCYIVLKYEEIKFIRKVLWKEKDRENWHPGKYRHDGLDTVDSYQDAVRMCALIPEITKTKWQYIEEKVFKEKWRSIPGDDVKITLPTPTTQEHLNWLLTNVTYDQYNPTKNTYEYQNRGKLWLDIRKSNSTLQNPKPETPKKYLTDKLGECGYLYRSMNNKETGLYWVQCEDKRIESETDADMAGSHNVACQFDEPADCLRELQNETCIFSETHNECVLAGYYIDPPLRNYHARLGKPCRENEIAGFDPPIPCPKRFQKPCNKNCVKTPWVPHGKDACLQEIEDTRRYYECTEEDGYGVRFQKREIMAKERYEGRVCPKILERNITCKCDGQRPNSTNISFVAIMMTMCWSKLTMFA